jgi:hypothetical protein
MLNSTDLKTSESRNSLIPVTVLEYSLRASIAAMIVIDEYGCELEPGPFCDDLRASYNFLLGAYEDAERRYIAQFGKEAFDTFIDNYKRRARTPEILKVVRT